MSDANSALEDERRISRERAQKLYELQKLYAAEHFKLQEAMRDLANERLRNAGAYAGVDIIMARARMLQERIADLKERLRRHEQVEDLDTDTSPIAIGGDARSILEGNREGLSE